MLEISLESSRISQNLVFEVCVNSPRSRYDQSNGPFEGVVGFSQGASLATLICSGAPSATLPELRFAVIMSGFCPADKALKAAVAAAAPLKIPAVVTHGKRDFNKQGSEQLAGMWAPGLATLVEHGAGHVVPLSVHAGGKEVLEAVRMAAAQSTAGNHGF